MASLLYFHRKFKIISCAHDGVMNLEWTVTVTLPVLSIFTPIQAEVLHYFGAFQLKRAISLQPSINDFQSSQEPVLPTNSFLFVMPTQNI